LCFWFRDSLLAARWREGSVCLVHGEKAFLSWFQAFYSFGGEKSTDESLAIRLKMRGWEKGETLIGNRRNFGVNKAAQPPSLKS
jgi:hypothetical protein